MAKVTLEFDSKTDLLILLNDLGILDGSNTQAEKPISTVTLPPGAKMLTLEEAVKVVVPLCTGKKIHSIKELRAATLLGLKESKDAVDGIMSLVDVVKKDLERV